MVRTAMPHIRPDGYAPETAKDHMQVDDLPASGLADRMQTDCWRKKLTVIRGEILEFAEQGARQGLVDLERETTELARILEQLETLLGPAGK